MSSDYTTKVVLLENQLGLEPGAIRQRYQEMTALMTEGVIISLTVNRWRGEKVLTLADLGIEADPQTRKLFRLGTKILAPTALLNAATSQEVAARQFLAGAGIETAWGLFLPVLRWEKTIENLKGRREKYMKLGEDMADTRGEWMPQMLSTYQAEATQVWRRVSAWLKSQKRDAEIPEETEFIDQYVARIADSIPSAEEIRESFGMSWSLNYIPLPSILAEDAAAAAKAKAERVEAEAKISSAEATISEREQAKRDALDKMQREITADARSKRDALVTDFLTDVSRTLRAQTAQVMQAAQASIAKNGNLVGRSSASLRAWVSNMRELNVADDREIERMCKQMEATLATNKPGEIRQLVADFAVQVVGDLDIIEMRSRPGQVATAYVAPEGVSTEPPRRRRVATENPSVLPVFAPDNTRRRL